MKASQFCLLVGIIHMTPFISANGAVIAGVIWLVNAAIWWGIER